jgi:serine/threonine protein kinase
MTPEQHQIIGELYHQALERPAEQRAAFLDRACGLDEGLRRRVEALLAAHAQAGEFLAAPDPSLLVTAAKDRAPIAAAGGRFGQYEVISLIGAGGMGEVYLAHDARLDRPIALKLLPAAFTSDADRVRRFQQEARAASATNHPNIITIYDIGEVSGVEGSVYFMAVEYIDGETLRERLSRSPLTPREALGIAAQAASALVAAHAAGVIHRDLKPENIMIRRDGYVKVLDFGLAKLTEKFGPADARREAFRRQVKTSPGVVMGTFAYMSPEQAQGREVDGRSDLFSLGCVLYEMIAGKVPFDGVSPADVLSAILNREPAPLARHTPPELERIIARALAKNRDQRYQRAQDLLTDLMSLMLELEVEARLSQNGAETSIHPLPDFPPVSALLTPPRSKSTAICDLLEPVGGAVPLDSGFYVLRSTDEKFRQAVARQDSIVLVKGARQVGKTSLLARGLQQARSSGARVVLTDFQTLGGLDSIDQLMLELAGAFADQLDLDVSPHEVWKPTRSSGVNFEQYLRREALRKYQEPIVWGLDEVDRLFTCQFGSEVFGLFRSWHNKRALDPAGPWHRLTLAIAYATEAHLFITDLNQSPFNVGTRLQLEDFTLAQIADLNER